VPDEEEIRAKTEQIAVEYEKKMQKMAAELAEARASSERTAAEMDRLKSEAEAKQRQLYADFTVRAESERTQMKQLFDAETQRIKRELETTRRGKELVQTEMDSLRRQYEAAMFSVENSVPPEQLDAERDRLKTEYEANMKVMRDELDSVKSSRANMESEMEHLKAEYESSLSAGRSAMLVAHASTSTALLSIATDRELRQQNLTDEMKIVSADRFQTEERSSVGEVDQRQSGSDGSVGSSVQSKLVTDSLGKYSSPSRKIDQVEEDPIDVDQLERDVASDYETSVSGITEELEDFKRSRDDLAKVIDGIKTEYQEAVWRAQESVPMHEFDLAKQEIREKYEARMDPVRDNVRVLKSLRDIATAQLTEQKSVWKRYDEERRKIGEDVEAGRVERRRAPKLIEAAAQVYFDETRALLGRVATERESVQTAVANERFERDKRRIDDEVEEGKLTETEATYRLDQLIKKKTAELAAARQQAVKRSAILVETPETNVNRKSSSTSTTTAAAVDVQSSQRRAGSAMERRLKTLEDILIHGGGNMTGGGGGGGGGAQDTEHCSVIREKLRREKLNAEEKQRRLEQANTSTSDTAAASALYSVFASTHEELVAKTTALEQLRSRNELLHREIGDLQAALLVYTTNLYNCK